MSKVAARIGQTVRRNREERGLSQEALAELAGIDRSYLGEIERGAAVPSIESLQKVADGLGVMLSALIREYEQSK